MTSGVGQVYDGVGELDNESVYAHIDPDDDRSPSVYHSVFPEDECAVFECTYICT